MKRFSINGWMLILTAVPLFGQLRENSFHFILRDQFRRYAAMQAEDVYKLVYQSTMGASHWQLDLDEARHSILEEYETVHPDTLVPLFEIIDPDSAFVRINLAPFKALHGNVDSLARAFVRTSNFHFQPPVSIAERCGEAVQYCRMQRTSLSPDSLQRFFKEMERRHFPSIHHSPIYQKLYAPAYRVIARQFLPTLIRTQ